MYVDDRTQGRARGGRAWPLKPPIFFKNWQDLFPIGRNVLLIIYESQIWVLIQGSGMLVHFLESRI